MPDKNQSINIIIEDLEFEIASVINKYNLPIKISELVLRDVLSNISHSAKDITLNERNQYNAQQANEQSKNQGDVNAESN